MTIHISSDKSSKTSFQKMIFVFSDLFVRYEKSFVLNCGLHLKTGKLVLSQKRDNVSKSGYV